MWSIRTTVPPTARALTAVDIREQSRIFDQEEDGLLEAYIDAATEWIEGFTGRRLLTQTVVETVSEFPSSTDVLTLHAWPVQSITVSYYDQNDTLTTWPSSQYWFNGDVRPPFIQAKSAWPSTKARADAVSITMVCGSTSAADVDHSIKQAIRMIVSHWYEQREQAADIRLFEVPFGAAALLSRFRHNWHN